MFDIISDTVHVYVLVFIQCNCATIKLMRSSQKYNVARDVLIIMINDDFWHVQKKQHKISLRGNYHFLVWIEPSKDVKNTFQTIQAINDYSKFIKLMKLTITKDNIFFLHPNNTPEKLWRKLNQNSTTDMWNPDNIEIRLHPCSKRRQGRIYILSILVYTFWRRLPLY